MSVVRININGHFAGTKGTVRNREVTVSRGSTVIERVYMERFSAKHKETMYTTLFSFIIQFIQ